MHINLSTCEINLYISGNFHSSLAAMSAFINKNKTPHPIAIGFLSTLAASVNIWCTNCTAFGTLATYVLFF